MLKLAQKLKVEVEPALKIVRLDPQDPDHWALYPEFEKRVVEFTKEHSPEIPIDRLIMKLRQRWTVTPELAFYVLVTKGIQPICHLAAWLEEGWADPFVLIYEAKADIHETVRELMPMYVQILQTWIGGVNAALETRNLPQRVRYVEFWAEADAEVWKRYFKGIVEPYTTRSVMRFKV